MSVNSGPRVPNDSLAAYFDLSNQLCFRGEPTTNSVRIYSDFSGNAYAPSNEWTPTVLKKEYDPNIETPVGYGATLIMESGGTGWHALSRYGGGESGNYCLSFYIKPVTNDITTVDLGLLGGQYIRLDLNTRNITYSLATIPRVAFIEDVPEYPGWLRVGANLWGRNGGWVGSFGYNTSAQYTGSISGKQMYVAGSQYETTYAPTKPLPANTTRGTTVATGGGLIDISLNGNSGEFVNSPSFNKLVNNNWSIIFDGINNRLSTSSIDLSSTNKITVSFWCKILSYTETAGVGKIIFEISNNFNTSTVGCNVAYADASNGSFTEFPITLNLKGNNGYNLSGFSKTLVNDLKWHYWCCIFDKSLGDSNGVQETILYIDGIERSATMNIPAYRINNTNNFGIEPLHIGQRTGNIAPSNVEISNFQIYNRVLSAKEIWQNFNAFRGRYGI